MFLAAAVGNFLKPLEDSKARIALVMPRSLMTAKHHRKVREGTYNQRFNVSEIWDLDRVAPLFNIPSCVLFVAALTAPKPSSVKTGRVYLGRLPAKDLPADRASHLITYDDSSFHLSYLGKRSAWVISGSKGGKALPSRSQNAYLKAFRQGAILYPQTLLVVRPQAAASFKKVRYV